MENVMIFGHKIPDTDSVCASISLSYLKNKLGVKATPRVLGSINKETKFVLDYFNVEEPAFLNDVKVQIRNMHYDKTAMINQNESIFATYKKLSDLGVTGLPIIDDDKNLMGYVNVKNISRYLIEGNSNLLDTSYDNIISSLNAREILRFDEKIKGNILAAAYKSETFVTNVKLHNDDILIVGDRYKIMEYAINSGIKLLVIVNNGDLPDDLIEKAKNNKVNVVSVPIGTYKCSNMIRLCNYIKLLNINPNPVSFTEFDYRTDFLAISGKLGHTNYPIVDNKNRCVGMMRLVDANNYEKINVILVDHNNPVQSADGLDESNIIEVIDHHNLSDLGTSIPINFRSMPVGCTNTIIYLLYQDNKIEIPKDIAGLMLSAILSDTLLLQSPTTTDLDREIADKLAKIAGVEIKEYGMKMLKAASSVAGMTINDMIDSDIKSFNCNDNNFVIGQLLTLDFDEIKKQESAIVDELNSRCKVDNKFALFFVTDAVKNGSYIFYNEEAADELKEVYGLDNIEQGLYMDGVVSRKKQVLPPILEYLERRS